MQQKNQRENGLEKDWSKHGVKAVFNMKSISLWSNAYSHTFGVLVAESPAPQVRRGKGTTRNQPGS